MPEKKINKGTKIAAAFESGLVKYGWTINQPRGPSIDGYRLSKGDDSMGRRGPLGTITYVYQGIVMEILPEGEVNIKGRECCGRFFPPRNYEDEVLQCLEKAKRRINRA